MGCASCFDCSQKWKERGNKRKEETRKEGKSEPQLKARICNNAFLLLNKATAPVAGRRLTLTKFHGRQNLAVEHWHHPLLLSSAVWLVRGSPGRSREARSPPEQQQWKRHRGGQVGCSAEHKAGPSHSTGPSRPTWAIQRLLFSMLNNEGLELAVLPGDSGILADSNLNTRCAASAHHSPVNSYSILFYCKPDHWLWCYLPYTARCKIYYKQK